MSRVTRFAARDAGPSARVAGFIGYLRDNGLRLGVGEAELATQALCHVNAADPAEARGALKSVCAGCVEDIERFDELFDGYWMNGGRVRTKVTPALVPRDTKHVHSPQHGWAEGQAGGGARDITAPDDGAGEAERDGEGRLVASDMKNLFRKDLRDLVRPEDIAQAEAVARRLGGALRDCRSRRRKAARHGDRIDFRKVMRASLASGGEPLDLPKRHRPDRTPKIAALCDVSGSMTVYSRILLAFLAGLMRSDPRTDAYLFHTRLVRITDALRDKDAMRALARLSLLADGFAGGSRIGASLAQFSRTYARRFVDGRTVVLILSDGYDTDPASETGRALRRLRKRGCRIVWLNPLKGWAEYEPVAAAMAAALPHVDHFAAANTLADLAALEGEFARL